MLTSATATRRRQISQKAFEDALFQRPERRASAGSCVLLLVGNSATRSRAISRASDRHMPSNRTIIGANWSTASRFSKDESRVASSHGSSPSCVSAEITLKGMPFRSSPTGAKRKSSRSGRRGLYRGRRAIAVPIMWTRLSDLYGFSIDHRNRACSGPVLDSCAAASSSTGSTATACPAIMLPRLPGSRITVLMRR